MDEPKLAGVERRLEAGETELAELARRAKRLGQGTREAWVYNAGSAPGIQSIFRDPACGGVTVPSVLRLANNQYGVFVLNWMPAGSFSFPTESPDGTIPLRTPPPGAPGAWLGCRVVSFTGQAGADPATDVPLRWRLYHPDLSAPPGTGDVNFWQLFLDAIIDWSDPGTLTPLPGQACGGSFNYTTPRLPSLVGGAACGPWRLLLGGNLPFHDSHLFPIAAEVGLPF